MGLWGWWNVNVPSTKLKQAEKAKKLHWTRETYVISLQFWHYEQLVHIKKAIRLNVTIILINAGSNIYIAWGLQYMWSQSQTEEKESAFYHIERMN